MPVIGGGQGSSAATSRKYDRWCFKCKSTTSPHTSLDSYRRHIRTHYTRWYCIPQGTLVHISDPDPKHLNKQNVHTCVGKSFTRKENLIEHYKKHHSFCNGPDLASLSKYTVDLKHFACGFCGLYCGSLDGLINHVDGIHYRYSASVSHWDDNKVIRTLLSGNKCWRDYLAARPDLPESAFVWDARHVEELQRRLEEGREPADSLCKAAFDNSNFGTSQHEHVESGVTREGIDISQSIQTFQQPNRFYPRAHTSERDPDFHHPQATVPSPSSQHWDWERPNKSLSWDPMDSETYGSPTSAMEYDSGPHMQPIGTPSSGERFVHHQHLAQPHAGSFYSALRAQSTLSSLSSDREASSLGQPNSTYSPEHHFTIAEQVSRPEMRYGRG